MDHREDRWALAFLALGLAIIALMVLLALFLWSGFTGFYGP